MHTHHCKNISFLYTEPYQVFEFANCTRHLIISFGLYDEDFILIFPCACHLR